MFFKELQIFYKISNIITVCYVPYYIILVIPNDNPERKMMDSLKRNDRHLLRSCTL